MANKYVFTDETKVYKGVTLHRIKATGNNRFLPAGMLGGFIESDFNLSPDGNCWICDNAIVMGHATVVDNAVVTDSAIVSGNACIAGSAYVGDYAKISGNAFITNNARVVGHAVVSYYACVNDFAEVKVNAKIMNCAVVCGHASVTGNSKIMNSATVDEHALVNSNSIVSGHGKVYGNARVSGGTVMDRASVSGNAFLSGENAIVSEEMNVDEGMVFCDLSKNMLESIRCQTGLCPFGEPGNERVIAYKEVNDDFTSLYDNKFQYKVGEVARVKKPNMSNKACTSGLHFASATYWNNTADAYIDIFEKRRILVAEILVKNIITVQRGKIRCSEAKIIGSYKPE